MSIFDYINTSTIEDINNSGGGIYQIMTFSYPFSGIDPVMNMHIFDSNDCCYNLDNLSGTSILFSYSTDQVCWSCYMTRDELLEKIAGLNSDYYLRIRANNVINKISDISYDTNEGQDIETPYEYTTQLDSGFSLSDTTSGSSNTYDPYANLDGALSLQQTLVDTVSNMFGIQCYYFKLTPNAKSKDITFKEYTLYDVESVKQIKIMITDGTMPSSKPEFSDWGIEFDTGWEVEIVKSSFATAFGLKSQPMEGDFIYIPMMKRMWMVNGSYEEKNGNLMWQATSWKVALVKYQEKGSVNMDSDTETLVNSLVKNKYDDLFGEDNDQTWDSGTHTVDSPKYSPTSLYNVFETDAIRKEVTLDSVEILKSTVAKNVSTYYRGTLISDSIYILNDATIALQKIGKITYQQKFCGSDMSISFIISISPKISGYNDDEFPICSICEHVYLIYDKKSGSIKTNIDNEHECKIVVGYTYLIIFKCSKEMNLTEMSAYKYTYRNGVPSYKLTSNHYWYDMENPVSRWSSLYDVEYDQSINPTTTSVALYIIPGFITNFKFFDIYVDNNSFLLQMYPTHQHLMINDTARQILGTEGLKPF